MLNRRQLITSSLAAIGGLALTSCGQQPNDSVQALDLALAQSPPAAGASLAARPLPQVVQRAYTSRNLLWHSWTGRPTAAGSALYQRLSAASYHGLRADSYLPQDMLLLGELPRRRGQDLLLADQALSLGLHDFTGDLVYGRANPQGGNHGAAFTAALAAGNLGRWIRTNEPEGRSYQDLKQALTRTDLSPETRSAIAINMERLRWTPEADWRRPYIRVNIPGAILETFEQRRLKGSMRVVTGRTDRPTPSLVNPIVDLKFSPDWTLPSTIIEQDYLPKLRLDPDALNRGVYEVRVKGQDSNAIRNWNVISPDDIFIRQSSKEISPLGKVRFSMYNRDAIFLHDTPEQEHFGEDYRAHSSGCIRVQHAVDLSLWILSHQRQSVSRDEVIERMNAGETSTIKLDRTIPASLQYLTTYVDGSGTLKSATDIYEKDQELAQHLGFVIDDAQGAVAPLDANT